MDPDMTWMDAGYVFGSLPHYKWKSIHLWLADVVNDEKLQQPSQWALQSSGLPSAAVNTPENPTRAQLTTSRPPVRKKSKTLREKDWDPVKTRVLELLKDNTLAEVRRLILSEPGFDAT
jgi:hypothetical protein